MSMAGTPSSLGQGLGPAWLPSKKRLETLRAQRRIRRICRDLYEGKWRKVLVDMKLAQAKYRQLKREDGEIQALFVKLNAIRLACDMHATVLASRPYRASLADAFVDQQAALEAIRSGCLLDQSVMNAAVTINVEGSAPMRVTSVGGKTVVEVDDNDITLPVGERGPNNQPAVWERRWVVERDVNRRSRRYLRVERHRVVDGVGRVEQEAYDAKTSDTLVDLRELRPVTLAEALGPDLAATTPPLTITGLDRPAIVELNAGLYRGEPVRLFEENDLDLFDAAAHQLSSIVRTHILHAAPKLRVTEAMLDKDGNAKGASDDAIVDPQQEVTYVQLSAAFDQMLAFGQRLDGYAFVRLAMSPSLLGIRMNQGAAPDSFDKLRLESTSTLAHARKTAAAVNPALELVLGIASVVESRRPGNGWAIGPVGVELRPELPKDLIDRAREQNELLSDPERPLTSHWDALAELHGEDQADAILSRIRDDQAAIAARNAASLGAELGMTPPGDDPADPQPVVEDVA